MNASDSITEIADIFDAAESILFITGAGISAGSGLPTYRGIGGLYEQMGTEDGVSIEAALSASMLRRRPELTWKYLWQLGAACTRAKPNVAHRAIAALEATKPNVWVLTQNIDGLHRAAGSKKLVEVHGYAFDLVCTRCHQPYHTSELLHDYQVAMSLPPRCPKCSGVVRPQIVLFEELLSVAVCDALTQLDQMPFDLVVSIGTTAVFPYIAHPVYKASNQGIPCVEINPAETDISFLCSHQLRATANAAMQTIAQALRLAV
jgi:NAD-dependent deacetylase